MEPHPVLLKDLLQLHHFQMGTSIGLRNEGILFYLYKKMLEEFIEKTKKWIEEKRKKVGSLISFPLEELQIEEAQKLLKRIQNNLDEFPAHKNIVEFLEKRKFFEQLLKVIEETVLQESKLEKAGSKIQKLRKLRDDIS